MTRKNDIVATAVACIVLTSAVAASPIRELVRFESDGSPMVLQGFGLVIGLNGTGDSSKELSVARPLALALSQRGFPILPEELGKGKNVALVSVSMTLRSGAALAGDMFDVRVSTIYSASSLMGGELFVAPLGDPRPGGDVFALASGMIDVDDPSHPTTGKVHRGGQMVRGFLQAPKLGTSFNLVLKPHYAGYKSASVVASTINQSYYGRVPSDVTPIAHAVDNRTIRITVPVEERQDVVGFVGELLSWDVNPALLRLPPRVIVNQASGTITLTDDVTIGAVVFSDKELSITTIIPQPQPSETNPQVQVRNAASLRVGEDRPSEQARLRDLLDGWSQMAVPIEKQIEILSQLSRMGQLHAELIIE